MHKEVLVAGGGIIGLSIAMEIAASGRSVCVLERGRVMEEASWAAAGMLAALDPENPRALLPLSKQSLALWPGFRDRVAQLSGLSIPFRTSMTLQGPHAGKRLNAEAGKIISGREAAALCPGLLPEARTEYLLLQETSLDPRDLCIALPRAARAAGVEILEQCNVTRLSETPAGVKALTSQGCFAAEDAVLATGAWAAELLSGHEPLGLEPRKGHIVTVRLAAGSELPAVIRTPEIYLVPRGDGRVVIGATVERKGFNKAIDEAVIARLIADAAQLFPAVSKAEIVESWAGLRPGTADGLPVLGRLAKHVYIAAGHYRNGILLAPATAVAIKQLLAGEQMSPQLTDFSPERGR